MDKGNKNQTIIVRIICLLLSFGLWLYVSNVENPVRTYDVRGIPVEVINEKSLADSGFAISNPKQFTVDLKIEGASSEISKIKKEDFKVAVDMSAYALKAGENTIPVQILSYPENINIRNNGFLGIKVNLEEITTKQLTIKSKIKVSYKDNIYEKDESINPAKVTVSGAKSMIDNISQAVIMGDIKELDRSYNNKYAIEFLDSSGNIVNGVNSDAHEAELTISVEHGKSVPVKVNTKGHLSSGLTVGDIKPVPENVNIIGSNEQLNKINEIITEPFDISTVHESGEASLKLNIPEGIVIDNDLNSVKIKYDITNTNNQPEGETSKSVTCNVKYINLKGEYSVESSDASVIVHLSGVQGELDKINSDNISVTVDLSEINQAGTFTYTPKVVVNNPASVSVSSVGSVNITIKVNE